MRSSPLLAALLLAGCTMASGPGATPPPATALHVEYFGQDKPRNVRTLFVVLHRDGTPAATSDARAFAQTLAQTVPASAVATILRPGFDDAEGHRSPGERGIGPGEGYGSTDLDAISATILSLRKRYRQPRIVLVGEGGGAALSANLASKIAGLVDGMVLVACPCSLPEWRKYMAKRTGDRSWTKPVTSLDPLQTAGGILPGLRAAVLVGSDDKVTPVKFSRAYAEALTLRGIATDYRIVPGKGHELLNDPEVLGAAQRLAASLPRKS